MKKLLLLTPVLLLSAALAALFLVQPFVRSRAYTVTASLDGKPIEAELLHPFLMPGTYFLHLPEARPLIYRWFGISFSKQTVFINGGPETGWRDIPYMRVDQIDGLRITNAKVEDHWKVAFRFDDSVQFSNESLAIALKRSP